MNPFPYQLEGKLFLALRSHALLADEMGLGKSLQVILAAEALGQPWPDNVLIVVPRIGRQHWFDEIRQWCFCPPPYTFIPSAIRDYSWVGQPKATVICSYEYATKNHKLLSSRRWNLLVLDEAHNIKNPKAQRTKAVAGYHGIVHAADRTWFLSGTLTPNHIGEMWVYMAVMGLTEDTYGEFQRRYQVGDFDPGGRFVPKRVRKEVEELRRTLRRVMLRREKKDVMKELPPISSHKVRVKLDRTIDITTAPGMEEWRGKHQQLIQELEQLQHDVRAFIATMGTSEESWRTLASMAMHCATLRRYLGISKVPLALELIREELRGDPARKLVVFHSHREVGAWLFEELQEFGAVRIFGDTGDADRTEAQRRFNTDPDCRVFIGSTHTCREVLNLAHSGCSNVIFVEQEWVPAWMDQAEARIHRPPQKLPVTVRHLVLADSLDEAIVGVLLAKRENVNELYKPETEESTKNIKKDFAPVISPVLLSV